MVLDYLEVSPAELPFLGFARRFPHPEDVEKYWTIIREELAHGVPFESENLVPCEEIDGASMFEEIVGASARSVHASLSASALRVAAVIVMTPAR